MYVGSEGEIFELMFRIYVSDEGWDGAGWAPAEGPATEGPGYWLDGTLPDGTPLSNEGVIEHFSRPLDELPPQVTDEMWYGLVNADDNDPRQDPASAPALPDPQWEVFHGMQYTLVGLFKGPEFRASVPLQTEMVAGEIPRRLT